MRNPLRRRTADAPTTPQGADEPAASSAAAKPAPETPRASSDPHERIDGLRAWLAQVDRKLGIRSYAGGAAIVLALAAGIVGVVLALSAKDESATKDEVRSLRDQLGTVTEEASSAAAEEVSTLSDRVDALEQQVSSLNGDQTTLERELEVVQDDIDDLRNQASSGGGGPGQQFDQGSASPLDQQGN